MTRKKSKTNVLEFTEKITQKQDLKAYENASKRYKNVHKMHDFNTQITPKKAPPTERG